MISISEGQCGQYSMLYKWREHKVVVSLLGEAEEQIGVSPPLEVRHPHTIQESQLGGSWCKLICTHQTVAHRTQNKQDTARWNPSSFLHFSCSLISFPSSMRYNFLQQIYLIQLKLQVLRLMWHRSPDHSWLAHTVKNITRNTYLDGSVDVSGRGSSPVHSISFV